MTDGFIRNLLVRHEKKLKAKYIPIELVLLKRQELEIKRYLKGEIE